MRRFVGIALLGLVTTPVAMAESPQNNDVYSLASPADQRVSQAVERTLQGLSALVRPIARPRLRAGADWCRRYRFDLAGDRISVDCDGQSRWSSAVSESGGRYVDADGRVGVMEVRKDADTIDITTRFDEGERQTVFEFDGDVVRVREAIRSSRLSVPVEWELVYERAPQDTSAPTQPVTAP